MPHRYQAFLDLFERVFERYQARLAADKGIDFADMIVGATDKVRSGSFESPFTHIIIDEFQDITRGRIEFVRALYDQAVRADRDPKLCCVGDDWQSIYQFAGSDVSLLTGFSKHWEGVEQVALDQTFRFGASFLCPSSRFIRKNERQSPKSLSSGRKSAEPALIIVPFKKPEEGLEAARKDYEDCEEHTGATRGQKEEKVLIRYGESKCGGWNGRAHWKKAKDLVKLKRVSILTGHKSKGLEADVVHVLELDDDYMVSPASSRTTQFSISCYREWMKASLLPKSAGFSTLRSHGRGSECICTRIRLACRLSSWSCLVTKNFRSTSDFCLYARNARKGTAGSMRRMRSRSGNAPREDVQKRGPYARSTCCRWRNVIARRGHCLDASIIAGKSPARARRRLMPQVGKKPVNRNDGVRFSSENDRSQPRPAAG